VAVNAIEKVGWPPVTLSMSCRVGRVFWAHSVWSQLPPVSQWPGGASFAKDAILLSMAGRDLTPVRSTFSLVRPALARWVWASLNPGKMKVLLLAESMLRRRVFGSGQAGDLFIGADGQHLAAADGHGLHGLRLILRKSFPV